MKNYSITHSNYDTSKFVNRTEIRDIIMYECEHKMQNSSYFKVIAIYGIGGIGKTKLLEKIKETIKASDYSRKILHVSFEIEKNRQSLDNLIKIRKQCDAKCCLFDYALLIYWDRNHVERLNDDFMNAIKMNYITNLFDMFSDTIGDFISMLFPQVNVISCPTIEDIFKIVNAITTKISERKYKTILKDISGLSDTELLNNMPVYLGIDILHHIEKEDGPPTVFIFDSYQQSQPYSESQEWLLQLIGTIHKGLYIITSREELRWEDKDNDILIYPLKAFPEEAARELLEMYIPQNESELIETIIESTECVPIYVDLAIKVYERERDNNPQSIVDCSLFTDRNLLVKQFINHMPERWQDVLINLSVVRIFNQNIFEYIIKDQNLPCPVTDYYDIVNTSIIDYQEKSEELIKLHDVFCKNGSKVLNAPVKLKIFRCYLKYLRDRAITYSSNLSMAAKITLFLNVLTLEAQLSKEISFEVTDWEQTLDIFYVLYDMKAQFTPPAVDSKYTNDYNDILCLVSSIMHKAISTHECVKIFASVKRPELFGKHQKSYLLLWKYAESLLGKYDEWYKVLLKLETELTNNDIGEWYDTRTKLYLADYWIMTGHFKKSYESLIKMRDYMNDNYLPEDDALLICRYIGHLYRFNLDCENAAKAYTSIYSQVNDSLAVTVYIETNLCETYCYFKPDYVITNFDIFLEKAEKLKHIKNIGKMYYSRAIARIAMKDYDGAQHDINVSLAINQKDGYQSGELFAYMAQAYLDFAKKGIVQPDTEAEITTLIKRNNVYPYFMLPLYIMAKKEKEIEKLGSKYEWFNFKNTLKQYKKYLSAIQPFIQDY